MSVELYDTTLRDGAQGEGIVFSVSNKVTIIKALDRLGVHYIEAGFAASNPRDREVFAKARQLELQQAKVVPFGSTHHPRYEPEKDPGLRALIDASDPAGVVTIFGKSWKLHVTDVLRVTPEENLSIIRNSVAFLVKNGRPVIYDAEHFFDGFFDDPDYAFATLGAAREAGAIRLVLCDTNGGQLPLKIQEAAAAVYAKFDLPIGIHTHNDAGMGVANAILAVQAGATHIQGTFNGYGERCGNANLASIIPTLRLKLGIDCVTDEQLKLLTETSRLIAELANLAHDERQAYVGQSAFAHKGGMHIDAVRKNHRTFEHITPTLVGNQQRILVSDQSGKSTIVAKIEHRYPDFDKNSPEVVALFNRLKELENEGYQYEAAEGSFELLTLRVFNGYEPFFILIGFRVIIECDKEHGTNSEATIKVIDPTGEIEHTAANGDGPVNALDKALRKALERFYPSLRKVILIDYKVRVLDSKAGTGAKVRVLIESTDGIDYWTTVGVGVDVVEASWEALTDSLEYKLYKDQQKRSA